MVTQEEFEKEKLLEHRRRILELTRRIEDRCIESTADFAEMGYLQWEVDEMMERMKVRAIDKRNEELEKNFVGYTAEDVHESERRPHKTSGSDGYE